jgi:hypothetical protein
VRTVAVDLDSGLRLILAIGIASDVVAAVQNGHIQAQFSGGAFRDSQAEKTRADDDKISVHNSPAWGYAGTAVPASTAQDYPTGTLKPHLVPLITPVPDGGERC